MQKQLVSHPVQGQSARTLLEPEGEAVSAALTAPKAVSRAVPEELTAKELPKAETPAVPKLPVVAEVWNEKDAADGSQAAEELSQVGMFPDNQMLGCANLWY